MDVPAVGQQDFAAQLLEPGARCPPGLVTWNGSDPAVRFDVHRSNVVGSLVNALADTFPVVRQLVGDGFFRAMADSFVRSHPPRSRVLAKYGAELPALIEAFEPVRALPYLADIARLELAHVQAYHAADADVVPREAIERVIDEPAHIGTLHLRLHPSVSVLRSDHAIVSIWAAHQGEGELGDVDPSVGEAALVVRNDFDVLVLELAPGAAWFATALQNGQSLAAAAKTATNAAPDFDLTQALALLLRRGAIASIQA